MFEAVVLLSGILHAWGILISYSFLKYRYVQHARATRLVEETYPWSHFPS